MKTKTKSGKLTNDVSVREARSVWLASSGVDAKGLTYRELEEKFSLRRLNGMTAYRVTQKYRRYLELKAAGLGNAAVSAGFVSK